MHTAIAVCQSDFSIQSREVEIMLTTYTHNSFHIGRARAMEKSPREVFKELGIPGMKPKFYQRFSRAMCSEFY